MDILSTPNQYLYELQTTSPAEAKRLWRRKIKEKWDYECAYCGSETDLTIDHVVPRSKGGADFTKNVVCCCSSCNGTKVINLGRNGISLRIFLIKIGMIKLKKG